MRRWGAGAWWQVDADADKSIIISNQTAKDLQGSSVNYYFLSSVSSSPHLKCERKWLFEDVPAVQLPGAGNGAVGAGWGHAWLQPKARQLKISVRSGCAVPIHSMDCGSAWSRTSQPVFG